MRVAIVGAGVIAQEHARAFLDIDDIEIVGVTSRSKQPLENFATKFNVKNKCSSIQDLYKTTQAELVIITVSVDQISNVLLECAQHPWTILVEKPLGINFIESQDLLRALGEVTNRIFVALNRRHYSTFLKLEQIINLDSSPRLIKITDQEDQFAARFAGSSFSVTENWMFANSIHLIDILRQFGRGQVTAIKQQSKWKSMATMKHQVSVSFDSGDIGIYECQWNKPGPWSVSVEKENLFWIMKPLEKLEQILKTGEIIEMTPKSDWDTKFKAGFRRQAELMIAQLEGKESKIASFQDAFMTMRLVNEMYNT